MVNKGEQITNMFKYIHQLFQECEKLIGKCDEQLAPAWKNIYGNVITKEVSKTLQSESPWVPEAIFRFYKKDNEPVYKSITISFWGKDYGNQAKEVTRPVITAGKIIYADINKHDQWDLWRLWFSKEYHYEKNAYDLDGRINVFSAKDASGHIKQAELFSFPLIEITNEKVLLEKVIKPLERL